MVWAPSRYSLLGGYWDDTGTFGYRRVPKYGVRPMWGLERWVPAKNYGNYKTWAIDTMTEDGHLAIGPFPRFGEYEMTYLFCDKAHNYLPLFPDMVGLSARGIWAGRINKVWDIRNALISEDKAKESIHDESFEQMWNDAQSVRKELSFGAGGSFNHQAKIEAKKRDLLAKNIGEDAKSFRPGFRQTGV